MTSTSPSGAGEKPSARNWPNIDLFGKKGKKKSPCYRLAILEGTFFYIHAYPRMEQLG
jgi:hypothetical protein